MSCGFMQSHAGGMLLNRRALWDCATANSEFEAAMRGAFGAVRYELALISTI